MAENKSRDHKESQKNQLDAGTYEILKSRLEKASSELTERLNKLNEERKNVFGAIETKLIATDRITTENNCVPRDMIALGQYLLFGYNVHIGLRSETVLSDVFSIYEFNNLSFHAAGLDLIKIDQFELDFRELYKYYKNTYFEKFAVIGPYLHMVFRIGKNPNDFKTFKWLIQGSSLKYEGNRSESEFKYPAQFEFEWLRTSRDYHRKGKHPHISVLDKVFIETVGGDLTIKVEDNTDTGEGIYSEPVEDKDQRLDDAEMYYADLGNIILLKIRPFKEDNFRYIVYNHKIKKAQRIDAIKDSCVLLPDAQGLIFSKGYYLQTGEYKLFENELQGLKFEKRISSPNGEDHLYVFYHSDNGAYILLPYNIIQQKVENLIVCNGYSLFKNGELIYFLTEDEASKHHVIQIWQTAFTSQDYVPASVPDSYLFKIGNKNIVRAMSECTELLNLIRKDDESYENLYLDIVNRSNDVLDSYFWIREEDACNLAIPLTDIRNTASATIEEFEKVVRIKKNTLQQVKACNEKVNEVQAFIKREKFQDINTYVKALSDLRQLRGEIIGLKELRYVDVEQVKHMEAQVAEQTDKLSRSCVQFLLQEKSLLPYKERTIQLKADIEKASKVTEATKVEEEIGNAAKQLEMLIEIVSNLKIEDATQTTKIIDNISLVFAEVNQLKAGIRNKKLELKKSESLAEFHAQIKLIDQSIVNYLDISDQPEKCDEYLSKVMIQIEELEGKFADFDQFITTLTEKREEVYEAFENRKLQLVEQNNRKANSLMSAAERILSGVKNRLNNFKTASDINGYFASDLMLDKLRDIVKQLQELKDTVKADDIQGRLKSAKEDALRQLKDKQELFTEGGNVIKFGKFHFSVNTQPIDLTMVNRDNEMFYHITGTGFFERISDESFIQTKPFWNQIIVSENRDIYKGEYLAYVIFQSYINKNISENLELMSENELLEFIQKFMSTRYAEGYLKGVSDRDALIILKALMKLYRSIDLLTYNSEARACARFWYHTGIEEQQRTLLQNKIKGLSLILKVFPDARDFDDLVNEVELSIMAYNDATGQFNNELAHQAAEYLFMELLRGDKFISSLPAHNLYNSFNTYLKKNKYGDLFQESIKKFENDASNTLSAAVKWIRAFCSSEGLAADNSVFKETALMLLFEDSQGEVIRTETSVELQGLSGEHALIEKGKYLLDYNSFINKLSLYINQHASAFEKYQHLKIQLIDAYKQQLRLDEFKSKVLSSFVRNKLIDEVYLPLIGANLAKQIGVVGENKRTDQMGMLLLISPPGYGKTTLMEYVASRLGLIFMKINGPALGHKVTSLDPAEATNAGAREELEKLNLSFEMGDNVMIYIDDIQHCNAEFLQKFISLCDGQRKIEGVYKGKSKTYDFRGKKVCVVMAGNPYTESGEKFKIPDMLANRADTYNLGDIIGGKDNVFKLSYIENTLTSNPVTSRVSNKSLKDVHSYLSLVETGDKTGLDFEGAYSAEESNEVVSVLKKLNAIRELVLKVNLEYIRSASQSDEFRTEPPFKLQGSYRNMNKMAEKVVPLMNDEELKNLILGHYQNESQTLTTGAEANLLKFKEIAGWMTEKEKERWEEIKTTFRKNQKFRGMDGQDHMAKLLAQVSVLGESLEGIKKAINDK
ncbi:MAG: DNA repair ATPase [Cytophagaceae bacterium]